MTKLYLPAVWVLLFLNTTAQQAIDFGILKKSFDDAVIAPHHKVLFVTDTLFQYLERSSALYIITAQKGYFFGTGWQSSLKISTETADHYDGVGNASVTEVLFLAAAKNIIAGADSISAKVYAAGADSMPSGAAIGTGKKSMAAVDTNWMAITSIPITSGSGAITGSFIVSIEYGSINDTLSIFTNNPGGDGLGEKRPRLKLSSGAWATAYQLTIPPGQLNCDAMIFPVVTTGVGMNDIQLGNYLKIKEAFPNPAGDFTTVNLSLGKPAAVSLLVFDLAGKTWYDTEDNFGKGTHNIIIPTSTMPSGVYYYTVTTGQKSVTMKFSVIK
ncbi:MAG: T9SS type A sorting domain-containing protein [Bacteroidetes bacterium]|nr:T9SS type A sorting domain-containing protein [Bacteroidota bacterium]